MPSDNNKKDKASSSLRVPLRPRKIRFSSTSPEATEPALAQTPPAPRIPSSVDSDSDEAPEDISLATAAKKSRAKNIEKARVVKDAAQSEKKRRRDRDERLKEQATQSSKRRKALDNETPYLPDSVLAALAEVRESTPSDDEVEETTTRKLHKFDKRTGAVLVKEEKGPSDIQVGSLSVSVLQQTNDILPPKAGGKSNGIWQSWNRGRNAMVQGGKQKEKGLVRVRMERRAWGGRNKTFV
jgi:U3 small nucleolar RNA-associated protein 16